MTEIEKYIKENQNKLIDGFVLPMVTCQDGFRISIQCGWGHRSSPKVLSNKDPLPESPSHFELGFPSKYEELLSDFAEDSTYSKNNLDTVFSFVPVETVNKIINKHGGIRIEQMEVEVIRHPHYKSRWAIKSRRHPDQKNPEKWIWFMGGRAYPTKKLAIKSFEYCFQVEIN